jgi:soluble lytic murein transglycosylase-like protein
MRILAFIALIAGLSMPASAGDGIVPVRQNGRVVFVNNDAAPASPSATAACDSTPKRLVYWSNTEHRWKRVPTPSRAVLTDACSAAREVSAMVAGVPSTPPAARSKVDSAPDTRALTYGRSISQAQLDAIIDEAAQRHNVDPNLVRSIIRVESNFNPHAVSRKGAIGLMQLMPSTARQLRVGNPFDPAQNVDGGVRHFKTLLEDFNGDVQLSLAAYNAGQGAVRRQGGVPNYRETRNYVKRISELYSGNNPFGAPKSRIKLSHDADGHRVYTND